MTDDRIVAFVLAGGEGTRLHPLTSVRSKPAVPFGARYRIVDFVLSNLVNSRIYSIFLMVQYKSQSLIEHIPKAWTLAPILPHHFVTVVPPQMQEGREWFGGTADAVYQNLNLLDRTRPSLVAVFGADHVYRMDVQQMVDFHRAKNADVTVAALPVPLADASAFGVIHCASDGRIAGFLEKPADPPPMPDDPNRSFASMGNYLFDTEVLVQALREGRARGEKDFGRDVLPRLIETHRVYAYDFGQNRVPGVRPHEEPAYWRDVGTVDAYFDATMDTLGPEPKLHLFNPRWPVLSSAYQGPAANILEGRIERSHIGQGTLIRGAYVRNSVIRREVLLEEDVVIEDSIIMDYCVIRRGARIRRAIVDRYNVLEGEQVGYDPEADRARYHVTDSGIVVIPMAEVRTGTNIYE
ncbi:MAG: glucose-1-phosphate adenylyltransferase [Betaproteobacteria bacterium]